MWRFIRITPNRLLVLLLPPIPRHGITNYVSAHSFCSSKTLDSVQRITGILNHNSNWLPLMESSDIPSILNPGVVRSVISHYCASKPKKLINFFLWSQTKMGNNLKDLDLFSFLVVSLCNSGSLTDARSVILVYIKLYFLFSFFLYIKFFI